jgi:hypothetical protein
VRELTIVKVAHPEHIGNEWLLVDHPVIRPLQDGEPTLGWEGDSRLAVYLHKPSKTFVLWRLESNGEYLPISNYGIGESITPGTVNETIRDLIRTDSRRGFDPGADVFAKLDARDAENEYQHRQRVGATADKLLFALSKSHLPGIDVSYPRNLLGG